MSEHTVVVGGSSGIGLATARRLIASGGRVTIAGRSEARLADARRELGESVQTLKMDACADATLAERFARIGRFDHLVLALGSGAGFGPFASVGLADVKRGFEEKFFAHFATAQAALPFIEAKGSITFIAAVSAHTALPGTAGIGSANAAVASLVPVLAAELAPIRVNGVSPGVVDTPWWSAFPEDQKRAMFEEYASKTPVRRVGQPDEIADAIAFLIGNGFTSGQVLICDGGLRLTA